jgi:hypothetical protein
MNVEIGPEAAQFPEKEYINGIFCCSVGARVFTSCPSPLSFGPHSSILMLLPLSVILLSILVIIKKGR